MTTSGKSLTLDDLAALNDELAAITRMGVPLDVGLRGLGRELSGKLGRAAESLQRQVESGQDLATALAEMTGEVPAAYRCIVLAGLEAGQLPAALQAVAESAARVDQLRRVTRIALFYPLLVTTLAYTIFLMFTLQWIPGLVLFYEDSQIADLQVVVWLSGLASGARWWGPMVPFFFLLPLVIWWFRRRSAHHPLRSVRYLMQAATLSELLAAMVERAVPLNVALPLAGHATGNRCMAKECDEWSVQLKRGETLGSNGEPAANARRPASGRAGVPAWIGWLLQHCESQEQLTRNLRQAAGKYRGDALTRSRWWARAFPVWVTLFFGGTATLLTLVFVAVPWLYVLYRLGVS